MKARILLFETLDKLKVDPTNVLEPCFGSGEFLSDLKEKYKNIKITGVEYNKKLYDSYKDSNMNLIHQDFLNYNENKFDLILGNPPYFVIKEKNKECMIGRPNIYIAFLYKCLTLHLIENGYLAFILPTSLFNCSYYEPMRVYIYKHCKIHYIQLLDVSYVDTHQDTMLIILQKKKDITQKYIFKRNNNIYISPYYKELKTLVKETKTIDELNLYVKTGDVVWNQAKKDCIKKKIGDLVDSEKDGTLLIYNTNIVNCNLVLNNISSKEKKQYVKNIKKKPIEGKAILVNRGYGNVYHFNYVYVDLKAFYAENHVNMFLPKTKED